MIRRDATLADGSPAWVLISQIEHARLAGDLAQHWLVEPSESVGVREEVLAAIYHHDDGWAEWEVAPQVDSQLGRPSAFTEMPLVDALAIWRRSIDRCQAIGPLAAWMTAGHFEALLRNANFADSPLALEWLREFDQRRAAWLAEAGGRDASVTPKIADRALWTLQFFDMLSLWFCCAERTRSTTIAAPNGQDFFIAPEGAELMKFTPWPLTVAELDVRVVGQRIAAMHYSDSAALAAAPREQVTLRWQLRAA